MPRFEAQQDSVVDTHRPGPRQNLTAEEAAALLNELWEALQGTRTHHRV